MNQVKKREQIIVWMLAITSLTCALCTIFLTRSSGIEEPKIPESARAPEIQPEPVKAKEEQYHPNKKAVYVKTDKEIEKRVKNPLGVPDQKCVKEQITEKHAERGNDGFWYFYAQDNVKNYANDGLWAKTRIKDGLVAAPCGGDALCVDVYADKTICWVEETECIGHQLEWKVKYTHVVECSGLKIEKCTYLKRLDGKHKFNSCY